MLFIQKKFIPDVFILPRITTYHKYLCLFHYKVLNKSYFQLSIFLLFFLQFTMEVIKKRRNKCQKQP